MAKRRRPKQPSAAAGGRPAPQPPKESAARRFGRWVGQALRYKGVGGRREFFRTATAGAILGVGAYLLREDISRWLYGLRRKPFEVWYGFITHAGPLYVAELERVVKRRIKERKRFHILLVEAADSDAEKYIQHTKARNAEFDKIRQRLAGKSEQEIDAELDKTLADYRKRMEATAGKGEAQFRTLIRKMAIKYGLKFVPAEAYTAIERREHSHRVTEIDSHFKAASNAPTMKRKMPHVAAFLRGIAELTKLRNQHIRENLLNRIREAVKLFPELKKEKEIRVLVAFGAAHYMGFIAIDPKAAFSHPEMEIQVVQTVKTPTDVTVAGKIELALERNQTYEPTPMELKRSYIALVLAAMLADAIEKPRLMPNSLEKLDNTPDSKILEIEKEIDENPPRQYDIIYKHFVS